MAAAQVILGPSTSQLAYNLASAYADTLGPRHSVVLQAGGTWQQPRAAHSPVRSSIGGPRRARYNHDHPAFCKSPLPPCLETVKPFPPLPTGGLSRVRGGPLGAVGGPRGVHCALVAV